MSAKARSPSGKTAWGDYGSARPDPQFDFGQEPIRDDADLSPTAMEGDDSVYMSGDRSKSNAVANTSKNQSKSCFAKIGGGIRCKFILLISLFKKRFFFWSFDTIIINSIICRKYIVT